MTTTRRRRMITTIIVFDLYTNFFLFVDKILDLLTIFFDLSTNFVGFVEKKIGICQPDFLDLLMIFFWIC